MPRTIDQERRQIEAEELKLKERRERLQELERRELIKRLEKSALGKLTVAQLDSLLGRIRSLGISEVLSRLA